MQKEIKVLMLPLSFLLITILQFNTLFTKENGELKFHTDRCITTPGSKLNSCQLFDPHQDQKTGKAVRVTSDNKNDLPFGMRIGMNRSQLSLTRLQTHKNHPGGEALFPGEAALSSQLNTFLKSIEEDPTFLVFFAKVHLLILHEIYQYLMSIYITFNMTHVRTVNDYLVNQTTQALNKKTMIINHLFAVIEAQSNKAILTRFPNIPKHLATKMGKMMMKYDYGSDLDLMMEKQEEVLFAQYFNNPGNFETAEIKNQTEKKFKDRYKKRREVFTTIFGNYLIFFKNYTATLEQKDPIYGSKFVKHANDIQKVLDKQAAHYSNVKNQLKGTAIKTKVKTLKEIKTINPPLFFYDPTTFRGMKIIPRIAKDLPTKSQNVPWPKKLVEDAKTGAGIKNKWGTVIGDEPAAYFEDSNGKQTNEISAAVALYVNIPTAANMYTQEVMAQPDWLNSYDGVMMMLRACLGDFTALFSTQLKDELIIDPCLSCIIVKAAQKAGISLPGVNVKEICSTCETYLKSLQKLLGWEMPKDTTGLPPTNGQENGGIPPTNGQGLPGTGEIG